MLSDGGGGSGGGSDPVLSRQAVQLHLAAAHAEREVRVQLSLLLLPVHVEVGTPGAAHMQEGSGFYRHTHTAASSQ